MPNNFLFLMSLFLTHWILEPASAISLREALEKLSEHPQQKTLNLDTQKSAIAKTQSLLKLMPSFSSSWQKSSTSDFSSLTDPTWTLSTSFNLFSSFQDLSNIRAQNYLLISSQQIQTWGEIINELSLSETYFECLNAQNVEQAALEAYQISRQVAEIEKRRYLKGLKSRDDYLKLKVDADNLKIKHLAEMANRQSCESRLRYWIGEFSQLIDPNLPIKEVILPVEVPNHHPKLNSASLWVEANKAMAHKAIGSFWPRLDLQFQRNFFEGSQTYGNSIYLTATWNLFDSGQTLSNVRTSFIDIAKSEQNLNDIRRELERDLIAEAKKLNQYIQSYQLAQEALGDIQKTFQTSLNRFRSGVISANEVALDQARIVASTFTRHNIWLQMNLSYLRYQAYLGRKISNLIPGDR